MSDFKPHLRSETNDAEIWGSVYVKNEYRLPDRMDGWAVIDVGAHIGAFSRAAAERGAKVQAYEPARECVRSFVRNIGDLSGSVVLSCTAVLAQRCGGNVLLVHCPLPGERSGHSVCIPHEPRVGEWVPSFAFADIVNGPVDLCKLDCEGCEYGILNETPDDILRRVRRWVIEFHAFDHFVIPWDRMAKLGFVVKWQEDRLHFVTAWFERTR